MRSISEAEQLRASRFSPSSDFTASPNTPSLHLRAELQSPPTSPPSVALSSMASSAPSEQMATRGEPGPRDTKPAVTQSTTLTEGKRKRSHESAESSTMAAQNTVQPSRKRKKLKSTHDWTPKTSHTPQGSSSERKPSVPARQTMSDLKEISSKVRDINFSGEQNAASLQHPISDPFDFLPESPKRNSYPYSAPMLIADATIRGQQGEIKGLQQDCANQQLQIEQLQAELQMQETLRKDEVAKRTQDLYLEIINLKANRKKDLDRWAREECRLKRYGSEQKDEAEKYKSGLEEQAKKTSSALANVRVWKGEAEHYQALNTTMEEDLDELRQIENEAAAQRRLQAGGLPPAYGSLDDEEQLPPYQLHQDSGSFDVATTKRAVREQFSKSLRDAHEASETIRASNVIYEKEPASTKLFYLASSALSRACTCLKVIIEYAHMVSYQHIIELAKPDKSSNSEPQTPRRETRRRMARQEFIADRVVKLIIEFSWRVISTCELRPGHIRLSITEKAKIALMHKDVDTCLLEALRLAFSATSTEPDDPLSSPDSTPTATKRKTSSQMAYEYQNYLSQFETLRMKFVGLRAAVNFEYFNGSVEWLGEQVETERKNSAGRRTGNVVLVARGQAGS